MSQGIWEMNAANLLKAGGPLMSPILLCSIFSLGITLEKIFYLVSLKENIPLLKEKIFECIKSNKIKEAISICDESRSPVAKILKAGIIKFGSTKDQIQESMENVSLYEIPKIESRLNALATIAHISPLLGLLGTVTGMISCFQSIQAGSAALNPLTPGDLAGGIGEALITTVTGFMVAIPTYIAYNYFVSHINTIILDMERAATELINYISHIADTSS